VRPRAAATVLTVLVLATAGCSSIAERATERVTESALGAMSDGEVDLDLSEGRMAIEGEDGESLSFGSSTEVPAEIAAVLDLPDAFEPTNTVEQSEGDHRSTTVLGSFTTDDPVGEVEALEAQLTADGWERLGFTNQNEQLLFVNLERGEESLTISLMVDEREGILSVILLRPS
jgi:hypothetical protein